MIIEHQYLLFKYIFSDQNKFVPERRQFIDNMFLLLFLILSSSSQIRIVPLTGVWHQTDQKTHQEQDQDEEKEPQHAVLLLL